MEDEEDIYSAALFELSKFEPNNIVSQMADETQLIDIVDQKITNVTE